MAVNNTNLADFPAYGYSVSSEASCSRPYSKLISEARKLADDMGTEVCGLLLGSKGA